MNKSVLFSIIFVIWGIAASYLYVCMVKHNCEKNELNEVVNTSDSVAAKTSDVAVLPTDTTVSHDTMANAKNDSLSVYFDKLCGKLNGTVIYFGFAQYTVDIDGDLNGNISELAEIWPDTADITIIIAGHSDNKGTDAANMRFSRKRAEFIKQVFIDKGIPQTNIKIEYKGSSEPAESNDTEQGRAKNRRVEIKISK